MLDLDVLKGFDILQILIFSDITHYTLQCCLDFLHLYLILKNFFFIIFIIILSNSQSLKIDLYALAHWACKFYCFSHVFREQPFDIWGEAGVSIYFSMFFTNFFCGNKAPNIFLCITGGPNNIILNSHKLVAS